MDIQPVYLGHDNPICVILKTDGTAVSLASITSMTLSVGDALVSSTNKDTDPIRWNKDGYETGEVRLYLGGESLTTGLYYAPLIPYDAVNTDGILWAYVPLSVIADPEAS